MLRFTNKDGTDISMDISGRIFANSVIDKNIPGSEIFSSPMIIKTIEILIVIFFLIVFIISTTALK